MHARNAIVRKLHALGLNCQEKDIVNSFERMSKCLTDASFQDAWQVMKDLLGHDSPLIKYFFDEWISMRDIWCGPSRSLLPSKGNATTNRVESFHRTLKRFVRGHESSISWSEIGSLLHVAKTKVV